MELSLPAINDVLDRLNSTRGHTTLLSRLRGSLRRASIDEQTRKSFEVQLGTTGQSIELVRERAEALFAAAKNEIPRPDIASNYPTKRQFDAENNVFGEIMEKRDDLVASCRNLKESIGTLVLWLRDLPLGGMPARDEILADAELRQADVAELSQRIVVLTEAKTEEDVYWYELPANSDEGRLRFLSAPLHVGKRLQEAFYPGLRSLIMTSATLSIAGKFNYFQDRLGLEPGSVRTLAVKSPFDYGKQVRVALPGWFPEPRSGAEFERAVIALLGALIPRVRRGTLVLFTSYGMLNNAYSSLRDTFAEEGILLLGQKVDGSRSSITNRFRQDRESVLFGTDSFWQGIDVPGESLELLIIVKLPFSVPSEPLEIAQSNALRAAGKDPFLYLTVPKAAVRFRQGFGRLIRHRNDKGAVLILDTRVVRASYGRAFHRSLPTAHTVYRSQEELIRALEDWFRNGTPADAVGTDQE
jgi:Rad3-related DNA helicase